MTFTGFGNFVIGTAVHAKDGECGDLKRLVMHPNGDVLTHLAVERRHRRHAGCLVPIELVEATGATIQLSGTRAEYTNLPEAEQNRPLGAKFADLPETEQNLFLDSCEKFALRVDSQDRLAARHGHGFGVLGAGPAIAPTGFVDNVPANEFELESSTHVRSAGRRIGELRGVVVDPSNYQVTQVLLRVGHLLRARSAAVPISAVTSIGGNTVLLAISKKEVRDLPQNRACD
jgi:uncharacterized protein YrrD